MDPNEFEEGSRDVLRHLKSDVRYDNSFFPRPFFIEITGPPSSGKTTTITELDRFFRRQGLRALCPQEGAEFIRHVGRSTPLYNIRTGLYALSILIDLSQSHNYDVVIFDRCVFDAYCWMMYWKEKEKLSTEETALIQTFFLSRFWINNIDAAFFMICDAEKAMERELRIALSEKLGEYMNPNTISTLRGRYLRAYEILSPQHPQLNLIDTTNMGERQMVECVLAKTLELFQRKINPTI